MPAVGSSRKTSSGRRDQRQREREPLLLAAGQPLDRGVGHLGEPDEVEQVARVVRVARVSREQPEQLDGACLAVAADPVLQHHADARPQGRIGGGAPEHPYRAGIGAAESFADLDRGRLAGAVRTEQREQRAALDRQRQAVHRAA